MTGEEIARAAVADWKELKANLDARAEDDDHAPASEIIEGLEMILLTMENRLEEPGRPPRA